MCLNTEVCRKFSIGTDWLDTCTSSGVFEHDKAFQAWYNRIPGYPSPMETYADEYCGPYSFSCNDSCKGDVCM